MLIEIFRKTMNKVEVNSTRMLRIKIKNKMFRVVYY